LTSRVLFVVIAPAVVEPSPGTTWINWMSGNFEKVWSRNEM
jgi:hypothetical protein